MKHTVFQQLLKPLTHSLMERCIEQFQSDYDCETFKTWEHLQTMIYVHLHEIKSLRNLEIALNSQPLGIKLKVKRSTVSDANQRRPVDCFVWLLQQLMRLLPRQIRKEVNKVVKVLDSSPIKVKGKGYEWAKEHSTRHWQGIKLHVEYDLAVESPSQVALSYANYNDSSMGQRWPIKQNVIYVFDKGYCDFNWWWHLHQKGAYFVTRLKKNAAIVKKSQQRVRSETIVEEGCFEFKNKTPRGGKKNRYVEELRYVCVKRAGKTPLVLVTNLRDVAADKIAQLYKARWEIELFFKWVKQHLKLKTFLGKSANAVKIQIVTALIAYLLVQIFKTSTRDTRSLHYVFIWVQHNLHMKSSHIVKHHGPPVYQFFTPIFSGGCL